MKKKRVITHPVAKPKVSANKKNQASKSLLLVEHPIREAVLVPKEIPDQLFQPEPHNSDEPISSNRDEIWEEKLSNVKSPATEPKHEAVNQNDLSSKVVEPKSNESENFNAFSQFLAGPTFSFFRLDGMATTSGSTATLISALAPGLEFRWTQNWSQRWSSHLGVSTQRISFLTNSNFTFNNSTETYSQLAMGAQYAVTDRIEIGLAGVLSEKPFYQALSPSALQLDRVYSSSLALSTKLLLVKQNELSFKLGFQGRYILGQTTDIYKISSGIGYRGDIEVIQAIPKSRLQIIGQAFYSIENQNTSYLDRKFSEVGMCFGISWSIGH
jgi:hypothetical protein